MEGSLERKKTDLECFTLVEKNNFINLYFAIVPALIKTFSSDLLSREKQDTKLASEHFLCYQVCCLQAGSLFLLQKNRLIFRRNNRMRTKSVNSAFVHMLTIEDKQK